MLQKEFQLKNGQILVIVEAKKSDASRLIKYANKVAGETDNLTFGHGEFQVSLEDEKKVIENHKMSSNKLFIVAKINKQIVGVLTFSGGKRPRIQHTGEFGMTVLKEHWGLGVGSKLIESLIDWAKKSKIIRKINLKVRTDNKRAVKLYKKFGFKKEGKITREAFINKRFYDFYHMGRDIN